MYTLPHSDFTEFDGGPTGEPRDRLAAILELTKRQGFEPRLAFDIGAHRGEWTTLFKSAYPDCAMVLVDPLEETQPELQAVMRQHENCLLVPSAVGDRIGTEYLTVQEDLLEASSLTTEHAVAEKNHWPRREVPVTTLDALIWEVGGVPDVLKIDAEGYELRILRASERIWSHTEMIFLEGCFLEDRPGINNFAEEIVFLDSKGFVPFDFTWFMRRPQDNVLFLCEMMFVRKNSALRRW